MFRFGELLPLNPIMLASAHRQVFQYKTWQDKWYVGRVVQGPGFESGDPWFTDPPPTFD